MYLTYTTSKVAVLIGLAVSMFMFPQGVAYAQNTTTVTVDRVVDGDTIEISPAINGKEDVRLIGVDTPETVDPGEPVQPFGPQASRFTKRQLEGKRVTLEFGQERVDQFDRLLAYVRLNNTIFNETLLRQGYAQLYTVAPNDKYEDSFRQAQQQARSADRGLWGLPPDQLCQLADRGNDIGGGCEATPNDETSQAEPTPTPADNGSSASERRGGERREGRSQRQRARNNLMESGGKLPDTGGGMPLIPVAGALLLGGGLGLRLLQFK